MSYPFFRHSIPAGRAAPIDANGFLKIAEVDKIQTAALIRAGYGKRKKKEHPFQDDSETPDIAPYVATTPNIISEKHDVISAWPGRS